MTAGLAALAGGQEVRGALPSALQAYDAGWPLGSCAAEGENGLVRDSEICT